MVTAMNEETAAKLGSRDGFQSSYPAHFADGRGTRYVLQSCSESKTRNSQVEENEAGEDSKAYPSHGTRLRWLRHGDSPCRRLVGRVDQQCRLALSRSPGAISTGDGTHQQSANTLADSAKKAIAALAICTLLAACTTAKGSFCAISSPIRPSAETVDQLTDAEVRDILAHNRKGQKLCAWRP